MASIVSTMPPASRQGSTFNRDAERLVARAGKNALRPETAQQFFDKYKGAPDPGTRRDAASILGVCAELCRRNGSLKVSADISYLVGDKDVAAIRYLKAEWYERAIEIYMELAAEAGNPVDISQYLFMARGCAKMYSRAYPEVDLQRLLEKHGLGKAGKN